MATAFLNGNIEEQVYMAQPEVLNLKDENTCFLVLQASTVGTRHLILGLTQSNTALCMYYKGTCARRIGLIIFAAKTDNSCNM